MQTRAGLRLLMCSLVMCFVVAAGACAEESDDPVDAEPMESQLDASTPPPPALPPPPVAMVDAALPDAGPPDAGPEDAGSQAPDVEMVELPPTDVFDLRQWLEDGEYLEWPAESAVHSSAGPHFGDVRTFVTPVLLASLEAGNSSHPVGAAAVKELYARGDTVRGWAVSRKRDADSAGGEGWFWYEYYDGQPKAAGNGVALCTGCHSGGDDFVLTPYPLQ